MMRYITIINLQVVAIIFSKIVKRRELVSSLVIPVQLIQVQERNCRRKMLFLNHNFLVGFIFSKIYSRCG